MPHRLSDEEAIRRINLWRAWVAIIGPLVMVGLITYGFATGQWR